MSLNRLDNNKFEVAYNSCGGIVRALGSSKSKVSYIVARQSLNKLNDGSWLDRSNGETKTWILHWRYKPNFCCCHRLYFVVVPMLQRLFLLGYLSAMSLSAASCLSLSCCPRESCKTFRSVTGLSLANFLWCTVLPLAYTKPFIHYKQIYRFFAFTFPIFGATFDESSSLLLKQHFITLLQKSFSVFVQNTALCSQGF